MRETAGLVRPGAFVTYRAGAGAQRQAVGLDAAHLPCQIGKCFTMTFMGPGYAVTVKIIIKMAYRLDDDTTLVAAHAPGGLFQTAAGRRTAPAAVVLLTTAGGAHLPDFRQRFQRLHAQRGDIVKSILFCQLKYIRHDCSFHKAA